MTSLIRLFGFPYEQSAGRSFREMRCGLVAQVSCDDREEKVAVHARNPQTSAGQLGVVPDR